MPTRGMERWLTQRTAGALGICANVEFPFPRRLIGGALAAASGIDPDEDPWLPERLVWPLLEVWRTCATTCRASASTSTSRPSGTSRSSSTATRCTGRRWCGPENGALAGAAVAGAQAAYPRARSRDPAGRARALGCAAEPGIADLPERVSLFGLTRLPAGHVHVLRALAEHRDVHLFLLHPSPALWERIAPRARRHPPRGRPHGRAPAQPPARLVGARTRARSSSCSGRTSTSVEHPVEHATGTLLTRLQDGGARSDEPLEDAAHDEQHPGPRLPRPRPPGRGDPRRDPPRARRRPDARAARRDRHVPGHRGVRAADPGDVRRGGDRRGRGAGGRATARRTCGCGSRTARCGRPTRCSASSRGCSSSPDSGSPPRRCSSWPSASRCGGASGSTTTTSRACMSGCARAASAGGSTPSTARRSSCRSCPAGTWRFGLDRLLLGVTMSDAEQRLFGGVLPLDDVESGAIELAGRMAEFVDRLHVAIDALDGRADRRRRGRRRWATRRTRSPPPPARRLAAVRAAAPARRHRPRGRRLRGRARARRHPRAARRPPARPADPRELPHRPPDDLHADADALGPAPDRLPARARRRRVPAQDAARRGRPDARRTRTWASATPAPRTASCCSTR